MSMTKKQNSVTPAAAANAAALANAVGEEMLARLEWVTLQPTLVLDVGSGAGHCTRLLRERYPEANVVSLDIDYPMLKYAAEQAENTRDAATHAICADAKALPFPDQSVDLVFANLVLPWVSDIEKMLREWRRVLRPEGLLVFTSLGPDTLQAWRAYLGDFTIPNFIDMHEIGDTLTRTRFADPVMDVEYYTLTYREAGALLAELQASGVLVADSPLDLIDHADVPRTDDGRLALTYEVVYGHAWGPDASVDHVADEFGTVRIPLAHLRRR
jgi:malonyl-CoA O-methyltransferase